MKIKSFLLVLHIINTLLMKTVLFISLILILVLSKGHNEKSLRIKVGDRFKVRQSQSYEL